MEPAHEEAHRWEHHSDIDYPGDKSSRLMAKHFHGHRFNGHKSDAEEGPPPEFGAGGASFKVAVIVGQSEVYSLGKGQAVLHSSGCEGEKV